MPRHHTAHIGSHSAISLVSHAPARCHSTMSKLLLALVALFAVVCAVAAVSSDVEATRAIIDSHSVVVRQLSLAPS